MKFTAAFLAAIVVAAYWRAMTLYFWVDDWDLFLKVIHPELGLWGMKPGLFGDGPYRYLHTPFVLLYPLFGLNASYYFGVGILLYFLATLTFYFLVNVLSNSKKIAIVSSALFASMGYVGSYSMTHVSNSYQIIGTVIMTNLVLLFLALFHTRKRLIYYALSIVLFWATVEFFFIRAHGIIFLTVAFPFILFLKKDKHIVKRMLLSGVQAIPFIIIFHWMYKQVYHVSSGNATTLNSFITNMSQPENWHYFFYPLGSFFNAIVPDILTNKLYMFLSRLVGVGISLIDVFNMLGAVLLVLILVYGIGISLKGYTSQARLLIFGVFWFYAYYVGYFISSPRDSLLPTIHRYLTTSTPGIALLAGILATSIMGKIRRVPVYMIVVGSIIAGEVFLANANLATISKSFSTPTKKFYEELKRTTPELSPNPVIVFDFENDPALKYQVHSSFPSTAIALFYGYDDRVPVYNTLEDVIAKKELVSDSFDNLHTFYISADGVKNTTALTRELLMKKGAVTVISGNEWKANMPFTKGPEDVTVSTFTTTQGERTYGAQPSISVRLDHTTVVPNRVTLQLSVTPRTFSRADKTYTDVTEKVLYIVDAQDIIGLDLSDEYISAHSMPVQEFGSNRVSAQLSWKTDQGSIYLTANTAPLVLIPDGKVRTYDVIIPAGGARLEEMTMHKFDIPVHITIHTMTIQPLAHEEILQSFLLRNNNPVIGDNHLGKKTVNNSQE